MNADECMRAGPPAHQRRLQPRRLDRVRDDARRRLHRALRRRWAGQRRPRSLRAVCKLLRRSFPDVAITIEDLVVEDATIVMRYIERGTLSGERVPRCRARGPALREAGHDCVPGRGRSPGPFVGSRGHARLVPSAREVRMSDRAPVRSGAARRSRATRRGRRPFAMARSDRSTAPPAASARSATAA